MLLKQVVGNNTVQLHGRSHHEKGFVCQLVVHGVPSKVSHVQHAGDMF